MRKYINKYAIPCSVLITFVSIILTIDRYKKIEESFESITKSYFRMSVDSRYDIIDLTLHESIKHYLKGIAEITKKNLILGGDDYQKTIFTQVVELHRIGFQGYIYLMDRNGKLLYHPYIAGTNLNEFPHIQEQLAKPEALIEYQWKNPEDDKAKDKIVYSLRLDSGEVIGISAYKSELLHLINQSELISKLNKYQLGESGYLFIVNGKGKLLLHPSREGVNIEYLIGLSTPEFLERVKADPEGSFTYRLQPDAGGKRIKPFEDNSAVIKDVQYRYYPYLDWVIVSGIERDELLFHSDSLFEAALVTISALCSIILMLVLLLNMRHRQLTSVLKRDYLTGLRNRRSFMEMAVERVDVCNLQKTSF
ncbi:Cache 3/Cache 2 fusion domain-containing protein [Aliivibrio wodanis]|uniref:Cache 3/Cache 2 fusion domain-containing protein n=1 Tax=Aliivibrio wodanis TaxID=80852 RepID=UPI00406D2BB4